MKPYYLKIGNFEYKVDGPGDIMSTPPSARGFTLKVYEKGIEQAQLQKNDKTLHELKGAHTMLQIEEGLF